MMYDKQKQIVRLKETGRRQNEEKQKVICTEEEDKQK